MPSNQILIRAKEKKLALIFGSILSALIFVCVFAKLNAPPGLDKETDCPVDVTARLDKSAVFIIDTTDSLEGIKAENALSMAKDISNQLEKYERFSVFLIDSHPIKEMMPIFSMCSGGRPESIDHLSKGTIELSQLNRAFDKKLRDAVELALKAQLPAKASPILESLRTIRHSQYWGKNTSLYLLSDFLQHSELLDLYSQNSEFSKFASSANGRILEELEFKNVSLEFCVVDRPVASVEFGLQKNALKFWQELFSRVNVACAQESCSPTKNSYFVANCKEISK